MTQDPLFTQVLHLGVIPYISLVSLVNYQEACLSISRQGALIGHLIGGIRANRVFAKLFKKTY